MLAVEAAKDVGLERPFDVIADKEIEKSVTVVVEPESGGAEAFPLAETRGVGDINERSFSCVTEEAVLANARDEDIGISVVVVVADGYAHAVELDIKAGSRRYIGEGAVAIVVIEAKSTVGFLMTRPVRAIDEKDVLPTVAIIVEKGASGAESFRQELPAEGAAIVLKMDTGLACDVGKAESDGIARGGLCREGLQPRKLRPGYQSSHSSQERPAIHGTFTRPARMA